MANTTLAQFVENLPFKIKKGMTVRELVRSPEVKGLMQAKGKIQDYFLKVYDHQAALRAWKVKNGYCNGQVTCMIRVIGKVKTCPACRKAALNPSRSNGRSEYGVIRMKEKKADAASR